MILRTIIICFSILTATVFYAAKDPALNYISEFAGLAKKEMQRSGIPASIKLAQALLESESGNSPLAIEGNNHFGIKCGRDWQGKTYYKLDDDADQDGNTIESCFRAFDRAEDSYIAHTNFLKDPKKTERYGFLFDLDQTDYRSWAQGLRNAGYASDPNYPDKIIKIIEKYELYKFDDGQHTYSSANAKPEKMLPQANSYNESKEKSKPTEKDKPSRLKPINEPTNIAFIALKNIEVNNTKAVVITQEMTVEQIAKILNKKAIELIAYNEMLYSPVQVVSENDYIYTSLKNKDFAGQEKQYKVRKGDSIESISNLFGIRANTLYSLNRIPKRNQPLEGEIIQLKEKVDKKKAPKFRKESGSAKVLFSMT